MSSIMNFFFTLDIPSWTNLLLKIFVLIQYKCADRFHLYSGTCLIRHTKEPGKCVGLYIQDVGILWFYFS